MASSKLGLLLLLLLLPPTQPGPSKTALVPLVQWRKVSLQLTPAVPACPKAPRWVTGLPSLSGRKKVLTRAPSPSLSLWLGVVRAVCSLDYLLRKDSGHCNKRPRPDCHSLQSNALALPPHTHTPGGKCLLGGQDHRPGDPPFEAVPGADTAGK